MSRLGFLPDPEAALGLALQTNGKVDICPAPAPPISGGAVANEPGRKTSSKQPCGWNGAG